MPRLPMPSDTEAFPEETRAAVRHLLQTRQSLPPPSTYLTYAGQAGALLSDLVDHLRYHTSLTAADVQTAINKWLPATRRVELVVLPETRR